MDLKQAIWFLIVLSTPWPLMAASPVEVIA
jgi:hypothetical protein